MSLSICIPTFNRSEALRSLLQSLCTELDFHQLNAEIVVSDNFSTDSTREVVQSYASRFNFVRYFRNESNVGGTANFDLAISRATSEHCWLLGDDSLIYPGAVKHLLEILANYPKAPVVFLGGNNQPKSKPAYLQEQFKKFGYTFPIDDNSKFLGAVSMQEIGCISELCVHRETWMSTNYKKLPSVFIYPQICSVLELMNASDRCVYTHRLIYVNTRASDDHNLWYLDRAPLSILLEWPWYQRYAETLGFSNLRDGFFTETSQWKIHQAIIVAGYHPYYRSAYEDICRMETRWTLKCLLWGILGLAPLLRPLIRSMFKKRYGLLNLDRQDLHYQGLPPFFSSATSGSEQAPANGTYKH